jgi:hypothetical protein
VNGFILGDGDVGGGIDAPDSPTFNQASKEVGAIDCHRVNKLPT